MTIKIQCLKCGQIIESKHYHDLKMCTCDNQTYVGGDNNYCKMGAKDFALVKILERKA